MADNVLDVMVLSVGGVLLVLNWWLFLRAMAQMRRPFIRAYEERQGYRSFLINGLVWAVLSPLMFFYYEALGVGYAALSIAWLVAWWKYRGPRLRRRAARAWGRITQRGGRLVVSPS